MVPCRQGHPSHRLGASVPQSGPMPMTCEVNEFCFLARLLPASQCRRRLGTSMPIGRPGTKTWTSPCISIWQSSSGNYTKKSITMWPTAKSTSSMMAMWQRISASNASLASTTWPCPKSGPKNYFPKLHKMG